MGARHSKRAGHVGEHMKPPMGDDGHGALETRLLAHDQPAAEEGLAGFAFPGSSQAAPGPDDAGAERHAGGHHRPLSYAEEFGWAAAIGLVGGLFTAAYSTVLKAVLLGVWGWLPDALSSSGVWTPDSVVPLQAYIVVAAVTLAVLGCLLATALPPHENIVAWIGQVHAAGTASVAWAGPMVAVSLLTVPSGASIGPEGVMIVVGGNLAGYAGARLSRGAEVTRWFSLVGASACVSSFFGLPLAGSFFVLSMLHTTGEPQHYEALKGALVASAVCCSLSRALVPKEVIDEHSWMFPSPGSVPYAEALLAGCVFGAIGTLLSYVTSTTDGAVGWVMSKFKVQRVVMMGAMATAFGLAAMLRPALLFWSEMQMPYALGSEAPLPILSPLLQQGVGPGRKGILPLDLILQGLAKAVLAGAVKAAKFPGGIIFPMVFAGGCVGMGIMEWLTSDLGVTWGPVALAPVAVMAAAQSAVNRTPWATIMLVVDTHAGGSFASTKVALLAAVVTAEILTWGNINMFPTQKPRTEFADQSCMKNRVA